MERTEEKSVNSKKVVVMIASSIVLVAIVVMSVSFAYFSNTLNGINENINFNNGLNVAFNLNADNNLTFYIDPLQLTNETENNYIESNSSAGTVSLKNNSDYDSVTCDYEVWFHADSDFGITHANELTIVASANGSLYPKGEQSLDLQNMKTSTDKKIMDASITATKGASATTQNWTFKYRHYKLENVDQNGNLNKTFSGKIYFKTSKCKPGGGLTNLSEKLTAEEFAEKLVNDTAISTTKSNLCPMGIGGLLKHDKTLQNGAEDNGYRYSGCNPNNFICFGPGSENYNNGKSDTCNDGNLYRIIGIVPVEVVNEDDSTTTQNLFKIIKSEYATHDDLGKDSADGTEYFEDDYKSLKRVKAEDSVDGFHWNDDCDSDNANVWGSSSLYKALNSNDKSFLNKLGTTWESKIEKVQWNVGGNPNDELPKAKEVYDEEWNESGGAQTKVQAEIGLMYPSDYGFASEPKSWEYRLYMYDDSKDDEIENNQNRENNWLFNGVYEWTISRVSVSTNYAFNVGYSGYVDGGDFVDDAYGVRPVFYLNSSVTLSGGDGIDGSQSKPFKVS